ncbi:MAG: ABC transporter permease [Anaerolineales bacterium]|nr:ABC transporter permease [Chloroflexota bacterium]MBL6982314.1 ABC transporter permease [Anaerolineales bacterium]
MNIKTIIKKRPTRSSSYTNAENGRTIIVSETGWQLIDWRELWRYRDLFFFLVWRDVKTRYAQSVLGVGWAIIQPLFSMVVFTVVFGNLAKVSSEGVPYALFSYTALVPWMYFSSSLTGSSGSLVSASGMISKVYFPRLVIPLAPVLAKLVDFGIALLILVGMMLYFGFLPNVWALTLPLLVLLMMLTASGMGMWLTALAIQYRDINYAMGFFVQMLMYAAPVVYPASSVPEEFRLLYGIFPMAGVIEGFRSVLLGTNPLPWDLLGVGTGVAVIVFVTGALYFRRMEQIFADVV